MNDSVLDRDSALSFPHLLVLKASAGSGKTYALSQRYVQFLVSRKIPHNRLRNIVAMTFSNNAAKEMRERILLWLRKLALGDAEALGEFRELIDLAPEEVQRNAQLVLEEVLRHYGDFQVCTIDSFTTTLFQASAVDAGYPPDFEILLDTTALSEYAFQRYLRRVSEGTAEAKLLDNAVALIQAQRQRDSSYLWDPGSSLLGEIREISRLCAARGKKLLPGGTGEELTRCAGRFRAAMDEIGNLIEQSGLVKSGSSSYARSDMPMLARLGKIIPLVGKSLKNPPVNKPKKLTPDAQAAYDRVLQLWSGVQATVAEATLCYAFAWYDPYVAVHAAFRDLLEETKRRQGKVFMEDINSHLALHLREMSVPDIYFRLGETIHHFFIDEFQDTSPAQWLALSMLLENAVAGRGSIFLVGDTKQAIYGFRDADYKIMADTCHRNPFPSAEWLVRELQINRRSGAAILDAVKTVFHREVAGHDEYREAAAASGLGDYVQRPDPKRKDPGFVTVRIVQKSEHGDAERERLLRTIDDLRSRKYRFGDIAVLTRRNDDAVRVTGWLSDRAIPFVSFSSLDIRRRPVTAEIIALLRFLDAPTDNLSFVTVLLGTIITQAAARDGLSIDPSELHDFLVNRRAGQVLYPLFADRYGDAWNRYFSMLLKSVGYLPLYDLVSQIYHVFDLFSLCPDEEATLMRLLETVKDFEGLGYNSLSEFLSFAATEEGVASEWQMTIPAAQDAVRVMTIHKAKGLGFPVAIVLLYEQQSQGFGALADEDEDSMRLFRVTQEMASCDETLDDKYRQAKLKETVNSLNMLYVGLTRPRDELHVIGIAGSLDGPKYPVHLFRPTGEDTTDGPFRADDGAVALAPHSLRHAGKTPLTAVASAKSFHMSERRRGEVLHAILAEIHVLSDDINAQVARVADTLRSSGKLRQDDEADVDVLVTFLRAEVVRPLFLHREGRSVLTEFEVSGRDGRLYRIDRLVIDTDRITVIDFKTGADDAYAHLHESQISTYKELVRECFGRVDVNAVLAYIDQAGIRGVA